MKTPKLSKRLDDAISDLAEVAMQWGWKQESGYGTSVIRAEKDHTEALAKLKKMVLALEQKLKAK